jgi:transposase InsO family protein
VKFAFIHAKKAQHSITALCRVLGVSRAGYHAWATRPPSARAVADVELRERVREIHRDSRGRYGSPRVHAELRNEGHRISKRRVERSMREQNLAARSARRFRVTTRANPKHAVTENLLAREFVATRPDERWVTDITYIWTNEGWCYLAAIIDLFSRGVVGWALDTTLSTDLPLAALDMALRRRSPQPGLLHHSDRGCQYTSGAYRRALDTNGIVASMSRAGDCWDNAVAESFFATLKKELVLSQQWNTRDELRAAVFEYIEVFYNRRRLHSSLGFKTPAQVETKFQLACAA